MFKNKILLMISVFMGLSFANLESYYDAAKLLAHCKTIGMADDAAQGFLQNPDLSRIKKLYKVASMKSHPDIAGGSQAAFVAVSEAKDHLIEYASQSYRVTSYSSSTKNSSHGSYSGRSSSGSYSSNPSSYSSSRTTSGAGTGAHASYSSVDELTDLLAEMERINKTGWRTEQDRLDHAALEKRLDAYLKKAAESSSTGSTYAGSTGSKPGASSYNTSSRTTSSGTHPYTTYASGSAGSKGYDSGYTSYNSDFKPAGSVKYNTINRPMVALRVGAFGVVGAGVCYGFYTLKNRLDQRRKQREETQGQAQQALLKSIANKKMQVVGGLGAVVVLGVIAYKKYNSYYGNDDQSTKEIATKKLKSQPEKSK